MRQVTSRNKVTLAVTLLLMVLFELFALRNQSMGLIAVGAAAVVALVVLLSGADLVKIGVGATLVSALTLTWNGWYLGPVRPGDVLPLIAILCFVLGAPRTLASPPWWIKQLVFGLILLLVLIVLFPTSQHYLNNRLDVDAGGGPIFIDYSNLAPKNISIMAKFIVAIALIPIAFAATARVNRRYVRWLALAFCLGTALSGLVAFIDHTGVASLAHYLTHLEGPSARTAGFTTHPNFLAETLVLAAPFACWMITSRIKWERIAGVVALLSTVLGVYGSGSRGGSVCIVLAIALAFVLLPRTRPHTPSILLLTIAAFGVVAVVFPSFGLQILRVTRLYGSPTTAGSDTVRDWVAAQGVKDFLHSPIKGIGMQSSTDASQVYLQQLAAGGVILFLIMSIYLLGAAWTSFRMIPRTPIAAAVCAAVLAKIPLNIVEASLTDRLYYVQEAILVAMVAVLVHPRDPSTDDEFDPAYVPRDDAGSDDAAESKEIVVNSR